MQYFHSVLSLTVNATSVFDAFDLIGFNDGKIITEDAAVKCVSQNPATAIGDQIAGTAIGFTRVRAVGVITAGQKVMSAATGGVMAAGGAAVNPFATALNSAADGAFVTILIR